MGENAHFRDMQNVYFTLEKSTIYVRAPPPIFVTSEMPKDIESSLSKKQARNHGA